MRIPSPSEIRDSLPSSREILSSISLFRQKAIDIVNRESKKIAVIIGPCSIHDPELTLEYAYRLKALSETMENLFPVMRLFFEKPRTRSGWKGFVYDPLLDGSNDFALGLKSARELLLKISSLNIPCATELLDPLVVPYFEDLISWGIIGARTSASQPHRQLSSGLPFPVGFKNGVHGELDNAIFGILSSKDPHTHLSIDMDGRISAKKTKGNPFTHLVLRGYETGTNFDPASIAHALNSLKANGLFPKVMIDCSHGNSKKDHTLQPVVFRSVLKQICEGNDAIMGLMVESHLSEGKQPFTNDPAHLRYGVSITDSCIGWEETESLLRGAEEALSSAPTSMSFVQN